MAVVIVVDGDGTPRLHFSGTFAGDPAYNEAYDLLKRGVLGHFQLVPTPQSSIDAAIQTIEGELT